MIALASLYDVVLSVHSQLSQLNSQTFNLSNHNSTECLSMWFAATHNCQCIGALFLNCEGEIAYADVACHIGSVLEWLGRMINSVITELWNYVDDPFHT